MFKLGKNFFDRFFTGYDKRIDINKDANRRGTLERYNEVLATELDENFLPQLNNLVANTFDVSTAREEYLVYLENMMGLDFPVSINTSVRRNFIEALTRIHQKKGTRTGYEIALRLIGYEVLDLIEHNGEFGFDNPSLTFDDENRRFDGTCYGCTDYTLELSASQLPDIQGVNILRKVIDLVEPINARIRLLTVNGVNIMSLCEDGTFEIYVDCDYVVDPYVE